jgi:hypothetical protein
MQRLLPRTIQPTVEEKHPNPSPPLLQNYHQFLALASSSDGGSAGVLFSVSRWIAALRNEISSFLSAKILKRSSSDLRGL